MRYQDDQMIVAFIFKILYFIDLHNAILLERWATKFKYQTAYQVQLVNTYTPMHTLRPKSVTNNATSGD